MARRNKDRPPKEVRDKLITVLCSDEERQRWHEAAEYLGTDLSTHVREAMSRLVRRRKQLEERGY